MVEETRNNRKNSFIKVIWALVIAVVWELAVRSGVVSSMLLPSLSSVFVRLWQGLVDSILLISYMQSIAMILGGLLISQALVLVMIFLDYNSVVLRNLFELLASVFHPLPGIAMLPVIMIWFGIGREGVMVVIIHAAIWSMYLNLKKGIEQIDDSLIEAAHNNGASRWQLYRHVLLTCAFKDNLTGLRIGWARGWRGLISAEMVFGAISTIGGIGWFMYERRAFMDITGMYAGILLVVLTGIFVEDIVFERWLSRWYRS